MTMSASDVAKAISTFENDNPQFVKAAELFYGYTQNLLRVKFEQGFISEDVFNDLSDRYDYAPLNRVMTDRRAGRQCLGTLSKAGANDKRNKRRMMNRQVNSLRDFVNPVESVIQDTYATAQRAATNNVIRALTQLAEAVGPGGGAVAERIPAHEARALRGGDPDVLRAAIPQNGVEEAEGEALLETADLPFDQSKTQPSSRRWKRRAKNDASSTSGKAASGFRSVSAMTGSGQRNLRPVLGDRSGQLRHRDEGAHTRGDGLPRRRHQGAGVHRGQLFRDQIGNVDSVKKHRRHFRHRLEKWR